MYLNSSHQDSYQLSQMTLQLKVQLAGLTDHRPTNSQIRVPVSKQLLYILLKDIGNEGIFQKKKKTEEIEAVFQSNL
jgi:hypothetical protein